MGELPGDVARQGEVAPLQDHRGRGLRGHLEGVWDHCMRERERGEREEEKKKRNQIMKAVILLQYSKGASEPLPLLITWFNSTFLYCGGMHLPAISTCFQK